MNVKCECQCHENFYPIKENMIMTKKPKIKLTGQNGNILNSMGIAIVALKKAGQRDNASEMIKKISSAKSYDEALKIIKEYCEVS